MHTVYTEHHKKLQGNDFSVYLHVQQFLVSFGQNLRNVYLLMLKCANWSLTPLMAFEEMSNYFCIPHSYECLFLRYTPLRKSFIFVNKLLSVNVTIFR